MVAIVPVHLVVLVMPLVVSMPLIVVIALIPLVVTAGVTAICGGGAWLRGDGGGQDGGDRWCMVKGVTVVTAGITAICGGGGAWVRGDSSGMWLRG